MHQSRASRLLARRIGLAVAALLAFTTRSAIAGPDWNVENTGEPYVDAEFTLSEGTWISVDVSPDDRTLVFDLLGDIYTLPATGGDATLVHGGPAMQRAPRFSPDGRQILYVSDASGGDNAWISNTDGSGARQVTRETVDAITGPAWGPDGEYVVAARLFSSDSALHASELRIFDLAGGMGRRIVAPPANGENVHEPQVSADGRHLYYTEKTSPPTASYVYIDAMHVNYTIKQRDLQTGETVELVSGFGSATTPQVSPDGRQLAFVRRVKQKTVLFVYDFATREQRPLFDRLDRDAQADYIGQGLYYPQYAWFHDNQRLVIWAGGRLWSVDARSGVAAEIPFRVQARHRITKPPRFTHDLAPQTLTVRAIRQLAYSPDGEHVVFNALGRLWVKRGAATPVRLTRSTALEFEPAFSPDGRTLAYVEWDDERGSELKLAAPDGGSVRTLVTSAGVLRSPSFSADGRRLVYKIDAGDRCLGGHQARTGTYWIEAKGGESHYVTVPGDAPMFSAGRAADLLLDAGLRRSRDGHDTRKRESRWRGSPSAREDARRGHVGATAEPGPALARISRPSAVLRNAVTRNRRRVHDRYVRRCDSGHSGQRARRLLAHVVRGLEIAALVARRHTLRGCGRRGACARHTAAQHEDDRRSRRSGRRAERRARIHERSDHHDER